MRELDADLQKSFSEMGKMAAFYAHQLRMPLSSAVLYAEHLAKHPLHPESSQWIAKIQDCHEQMAQQLQDLLLFLNRKNLKLSLIDLQDFSLRLAQQAQAFMAREALAFQIHNAVTPQNHALHEASMVQAVLNLLKNALQSSATCINMSIYQEKNAFIIRIEDNGAGMSKAVKQKALALFFTTKPSGTGLGLALVDAVVKAHGGKLRLESQLGEGSCITISLP